MSQAQMAEIKNLLIDLVRQHPLIYDKGHPCTIRQMPEMKSGMRSVKFCTFLVSYITVFALLCGSIYKCSLIL